MRETWFTEWNKKICKKHAKMFLRNNRIDTYDIWIVLGYLNYFPFSISFSFFLSLSVFFFIFFVFFHYSNFSLFFHIYSNIFSYLLKYLLDFYKRNTRCVNNNACNVLMLEKISFWNAKEIATINFSLLYKFIKH